MGIGHFFILLIMVSNLCAAKSIAPCEATETYFNLKNIEFLILVLVS